MRADIAINLPNPLLMLKNYVLSIVRNFRRNRSLFLLNVLGLTLGLWCSILIFLWITDERSIDGFHSQNVYTVYKKAIHDGKVEGRYDTPGILADELKKNFPEVKYAVNSSSPSLVTFEANNKILKQTGIYAGADFFRVFNFPVLKGNAAAPLNTTTDIALSKKMAEIYFGSADNAIGKTIRYENIKDMMVTAVFDDVHKTSENFDYVINWQTFLEENPWATNMNNSGPNTTLLLQDGVDPQKFEKTIEHFIDKGEKKNGLATDLALQRFNERYLNSNIKNGSPEGGRIEYIRMFGLIAIGILLIACINFMNLSTAYSLKRSKEVGIRKAIGAGRTALFLQFITESLMFSLVSMGIALLLVSVFLPSFNVLMDKNMEFPLHNTEFWITALTIGIITGLFAGIYPAFFMSAFQPVKVLKGIPKFDFKTVVIRKGLVVFQFFLCIGFIVSTIVVKKQIIFLQKKELGYSRDNLLYIPLDGELSSDYKVFKEKIAAIPSIIGMSVISQPPTRLLSGTFNLEWMGKDPSFKPRFSRVSIGYDFVKTLGLKFVEGRDFSNAFQSDTAGLLVNEEALKVINIKDPLLQTFKLGTRHYQILGVVKDFHFNSLHDPIQPLIMPLNTANEGIALVKTQGSHTKEALTSLEAICKQLNPKFPFSYKFADEEYAKLYKADQLIDKLSFYFTFLAIAISCLGLLGLSIFSIEQRTKEISVRKILGAKFYSLFLLLSVDFLKLVLFALVLAIPASWYVMNKWLQDYTDRVTVNLWIFFFAGIAAIAIALVTISFHAIKALLANPVKNLRSE